MQDISVNLSDYMDPEPQQSQQINIEDFMPKDPEMDRLEEERLFQDARRKKAASQIDQYQSDLAFDPVATTSQEYKDKFKWKGATKKRKLGTIGLGILDFLGNMQGRGIKDVIEDKNEKIFNNRKATIPGQITTERITETNANDKIAQLNKERELRDKNNATIAYKNALMKMTGAAQQEKLRQGWEALSQKGEVNSANIQKLIAEAALATEKSKIAGLATNPIQAAQLFQTKNNPVSDNPAFMKDLKDMFGAQAAGRPQRTYGMQYKQDPPSVEVGFDANGNYYEKPTRNERIFNPNPNVADNERITPLTQPAEGKVLPQSSAEVKRIRETKFSMDLFNNSSATLLDDLYTGRINDQALLMDTSIGRILRQMTNNDPVRATSAREALNSASLAAIQHVRAITGGRPAAGFITDLEDLLTAKGGTPVEKAAAQLQQRFSLEMALYSLTGNTKYDRLFADPKFYSFMKDLNASIITKTMLARKDPSIVRPSIPKLSDIIQKYNMYILKQAGDKGKLQKDILPGDKQKTNPLLGPLLGK
jgi:hypothetical protein